MKLYADESSLFARVSGVDSTHNQIENGPWQNSGLGLSVENVI